MLICDLREITAADAPTAGSKASVLGELLHAGFPVPEGLALTTAAYFVAISGLQGQIDARVTPDVIIDPAEIETAAIDVRHWIESNRFPRELSEQLDTRLNALTTPDSPGVSFAARTSLPSEELATAFGSGSRRAAIGLVGHDEIERGIAQCWGALWTSRSMYYRHRKKIPQTSVGIGVLLQPMLRATAAGRMFTQNPLTGDSNQVQIESIWGLGAPLAQGRVQPDRFGVSRADGSISERLITEKTVELILGPTGATEQSVVPSDKVNKPSIADAELIKLAQLGWRIEEFLNEPQDIEWALVGPDPYILQSRSLRIRTG